jgi:hypothetical protein
MEPGGGQAAVVQSAALAQGDHLLGDGPGGFGLGQGRDDAAVFDEAANQAGQHAIAMLARAAQFGCAFKVAHKGPLINFVFVLGRFQIGGIDIHA